MVGYRNSAKGRNRIERFEQRGEIHTDLLRKLADELDIDKATIDALIEQDRRESHPLVIKPFPVRTLSDLLNFYSSSCGIGSSFSRSK